KELSDIPRLEWEVRSAKAAGATVLRTAMLGGRRYEAFESLEAFHQFRDQSRQSLKLVEPILRKNQLRLAIENHKDWLVPELIDLLKSISSEYLGVCIDTGN